LDGAIFSLFSAKVITVSPRTIDFCILFGNYPI
jgi:hypothetical protein